MLIWFESAVDGGQRLSGGLMPIDQARVSVLDRGLTIGDGVFETIKVHDRTPFALTRHLARLRASAGALGIAAPPDEHLRQSVSAVVDANADALLGGLGRMRMTVTHGPGTPADPYLGTDLPTLVITLVPQQPWAPTSRVAVSRFRRNEYSALAGVKSTSYAENAIALREAKAEGADEALLLNTAGDVCEGTGSNIVLGIDGQLVTPELASGCLPGITRQLAILACGVVEAQLPAAALDAATEAFLTSSTRDLHPVERLGSREFEPAPGPMTALAQAAWRLQFEGQGISDP
ncbi:MAG: 4-amino-4-deoxychorismate lyase [Actinobacteria bacterium]|nr:MAG: 4-amino-4-deoxychorismate lyase [Actinomycetota bacterium]